MGSNRFENFVFSLLMCAFMVTGMTLYNTVLSNGFTGQVVSSLLSVQFLAVLVVAFLIDWFIVGLIVKTFVHRVLPADVALIKKVLTISALMVLCMCTAMSALATIAHYGFDNYGLHFVRTFGLNLIFALPLNLLVVGPLSRAVFLMMFKPVPAPVIAPDLVQ